MWHTYEGGWWNNQSYTFNYGEDGDVIHLPNGVQSLVRRNNTIYLEVNGGHLALQLGSSINNSGDYIKYTYDGSNVYRVAISDYDANISFYDPQVQWYSFRLNDDSGKLYAFDEGCDFVLFGNDLDNYISDKSGNSQIWGGPGNDTMTGGDGSDTFFFKRRNY